MTASSLTQVAGGLTVAWFASHFAVPRATPSMPSVAMNGTTRNRVTASPLSEPDEAAGQHGREHAAHGRPAVADRERGDHAGERDRRADREVDAAAHDHERHADRADRHDHGLRQHDPEVVGGEVALGRAARDREEHDTSASPRKGPRRTSRWPGARGAHPAIAASSTLSGVQSATARAAPRRPRHITATRSQTPRSSGR